MSEQGRCKDCRWWGRYAKSIHKPCSRIGADLCDPAISVNEDYGAADFLTEPDFGCVLFEAKEEA